MDRRYFLDLAASGLRMPIGTHLVLHQRPDRADVVLDPSRLADVITDTARRYGTPLAVPLMDLTLEKFALLAAYGVAEDERESFHFAAPPARPGAIPPTPRMQAACGAIAAVAGRGELLPIGMCIGPFSLMTKLVADPITPVFLAGGGATAAEEPEVATVEAALVAAECVINAYLDAQIEAGAKALIVCDPAVNRVYFSPNQLAESYATFDRYALAPLERVARKLTDRGVGFMLHDCGELTDGIVARLGGLHPDMLSLGSSRRLWEDAALVPKDVVLYGNLPTKQFYAPQLTTTEVERLTLELVEKMQAARHPFILGSECDVLSVPGAESEILSKVDTFMGCGCRPSRILCRRS